MASISPSSSQPFDSLPDAQIDLYGVDAKIAHLTAFFSKPEDVDAAKQFVAIKLEDDSEAYVKIDELAKITGLAHREIASKTPQEVTSLIESQNELISKLAPVLEMVKSRFSQIARFTSDLTRFALVQLQGRVKPTEAVEKLKAIVERTDLLHAAIRAGRLGVAYVGKEKGVAPSLLVHEGEVYLGADKLGQGGGTKVSALQSMSANPLSAVKAVATGTDVESLDRHLTITETLNRLGVPHITPTHRMKVYSQTKIGEPKLVALVDRLDGDAGKLVDVKVHPLHACAVLLQVAESLSALHQQGYVHSDVKPGNILLRGDIEEAPEVDDEGNLRTVGGVLHDFGYTGLTGTKFINTTYPFMAPEILQSKTRNLSPEQDAFAFGVTILYMAANVYMLNPKKVFGEAKIITEIEGRLNEAKREILALSLPAEEKLLRLRLIDIAEKLMQIKPADRITMPEALILLKNTLDTHLEDIAEGRVALELRDLASQIPT